MSDVYSGPGGRLHKAFTCVNGYVLAEYRARIRGEWTTVERSYTCPKCQGAGCQPMRLRAPAGDPEDEREA